MRTSKFFATVLICSFVFGVALAGLSPTVGVASDRPLEPICDHSCTVTVSGGPGNCPYGFVEKLECGMSPFCGPGGVLCGCEVVGCTFPF